MPAYEPILVIDQPALSGLAKSFRRELASSGARLGHVTALNLCVRFLGLGSPNRVAATVASRPLLVSHAPGGEAPPAMSVGQELTQIARLAGQAARLRAAARASRSRSPGPDAADAILSLGARVPVSRLEAEALLAAACRAADLGIGIGAARRAVSPPVDGLALSMVSPFVLVAADGPGAPLDNGGARWSGPEAMAADLARVGAPVGADAAGAAFLRAVLEAVLLGRPEDLRLSAAAEGLMGEAWRARLPMWEGDGATRARALGATLAEAFETRGLAAVRFPDGSMRALRVGQLVEGLRQPEAASPAQPRAWAEEVRSSRLPAEGVAWPRGDAPASPRVALLSALRGALGSYGDFAAFRGRLLDAVDAIPASALAEDEALGEAVDAIRRPDADDAIRVAARVLLSLDRGHPAALDAEQRTDAEMAREGAVGDPRNAAWFLRDAVEAMLEAAGQGAVPTLPAGPRERPRAETVAPAARFCLARGGLSGRGGLHLFSESRDTEEFHTFEFGGDPETADLLDGEFEWLRGVDAVNGAVRFALDALSCRAPDALEGGDGLVGRISEYLAAGMPRGEADAAGLRLLGEAVGVIGDDARGRGVERALWVARAALAAAPRHPVETPPPRR